MSDNSEYIISLTDSMCYLIDVLKNIDLQKKDEILIEYMRKIIDNYELPKDAENILHDLGILPVKDMQID